MTGRRVREDDTSVLPAAQREDDPHSHPLPLYVRLLLGAFSGALALLGYLYVHDRQVQAEQAERTAVQVAAEVQRQLTRELDERTRARDVQVAETNRRTRSAVCRVLTDLPDTENVRALALEFRCP